MRIALWNGSGLDNHGDRLLDQVNRVELSRRLPSAAFETFCPWSEGPDCKRLRVDTDGRWCGEGAFDAIVIGGGALLMGPPFSHPGMQSFFLGPYPERFRDKCFVSWNAVCSGSQFASSLLASWKEYVQAAARRIDFASVRNTRTREFLMQCEVAEAPTVVGDPVVLMREPRTRRSRVRGRRLGIAVARPAFPEEFLRAMGNSAVADLVGANPAVVRIAPGVGPEDYDELRYAQQLAALVQPMVKDHEVEIAVIPNVYGDEKPAGLLANLLGDTCRTVTVLQKEGKRLMTWIESLDCLVASRLHYCVLALAAGTPVVALDPYYSNVLGTSKLCEFMTAGPGRDCWMPLTAALEGEPALPRLVERAFALADRGSDVHARLWAAAAAHFDQLAERIRLGVRHRE
jgi:hypothetical protein